MPSSPGAGATWDKRASSGPHLCGSGPSCQHSPWLVTAWPVHSAAGPAAPWGGSELLTTSGRWKPFAFIGGAPASGPATTASSWLLRQHFNISSKAALKPTVALDPTYSNHLPWIGRNARTNHTLEELASQTSVRKDQISRTWQPSLTPLGGSGQKCHVM